MLLLAIGGSSPIGLHVLIIFLFLSILLALIMRLFGGNTNSYISMRSSHLEIEKEKLRQQVRDLEDKQRELYQELDETRKRNYEMQKEHTASRWFLNLLVSLIIMLFGQVLVDFLKQAIFFIGNF